jgi:WXG100 family type VII secretion target
MYKKSQKILGGTKMALIRVTSNELRSTGAELSGLNAQLKNQAEEFINGANALGATWEGETKQAFMQAANSDKEQMDQFMAMIDKYCAALDEIAAAYDQAESANTATATARKY